MKPVGITIFCLPDWRLEGNIRKISRHIDQVFLVSSRLQANSEMVSNFLVGTECSICGPANLSSSQIVRNRLSFQISYDTIN